MRDYWLEGYQPGAPSEDAEKIDVAVAESVICPYCGSRCQYAGWHKEGSYIALAVCPECDWDREF